MAIQLMNEDESVPSNLRPLRWPFVVLAAIAVAGGFYCAAGFVMAADFTVADPAHLAHWRSVAKTYLALAALAAVVFCAALAGLWRSRRLRREIASPAI